MSNKNYSSKIHKYFSWMPIKDNLFKTRVIISIFTTLFLCMIMANSLIFSIILLFHATGENAQIKDFLFFLIPMFGFSIAMTNYFLTSWITKSTKKEIIKNQKEYLIISWITFGIWNIFFIKKITKENNSLSIKDEKSEKEVKEEYNQANFKLFRIISNKTRFKIFFWKRIMYITIIIIGIWGIIAMSSNIDKINQIVYWTTISIIIIILLIAIFSWLVTIWILKSTKEEILKNKKLFLWVSYCTWNIWCVIFIKKHLT